MVCWGSFRTGFRNDIKVSLKGLLKPPKKYKTYEINVIELAWLKCILTIVVGKLPITILARDPDHY